jgi:phytoene dehydrogenase-like protein
MSTFDHIVVGSGINGLVCACLLAKAGHSVCLIEAEARAGGAIYTAEATLAGFHHDLMACWYPLFLTSPAYATLGTDIARHGVEFLFNDTPTATLLPDGRAAILSTNREANIAELNRVNAGDGSRFQHDMDALNADLSLTFGLLGGALWSRGTMVLLGKAAWERGATGLAKFAGDVLRPARHWLNGYEGDLTRALFAPWVLHAGLGPSDPMSGQIGRVIAFTLESAGVPVVKGGGSSLVHALLALFQEYGGVVSLSTEVQRICVERGRAVGVYIKGGHTIAARKAVVASIPPHRLYGKMLPPEAVPTDVATRAAAYRFGRAGMQIHIALDEPARWQDARLDSVGMVHLTSGMEAIALSVASADAGALPANPTIVVGQPAVQDPSRVPVGKGMLWIQLQDLPRYVRADLATDDPHGLIDIPADGRWTDALAERYADRILAKIATAIPGLPEKMLARRVIGPHALEALNRNLVGGDPYCGDCSIDQFGIWRPVAGVRGPATPVRGLYHIGASAHPGPGLGAGSGTLVANLLK